MHHPEYGSVSVLGRRFAAFREYRSVEDVRDVAGFGLSVLCDILLTVLADEESPVLVQVLEYCIDVRLQFLLLDLLTEAEEQKINDIISKKYHVEGD